ncbi:hypothetical protein CYFUS_005491 [Cystobacter fuscus]|uniref:NAD-dependent epimerase/dehydratase domain-containing protein n=1 Tax=Cystobacter fuscus TaxID=43 RepID=A0A250J8X9_9BACT|nr:hypothetical protein CYFUS_005491 [Cystobacter fuscus]
MAPMLFLRAMLEGRPLVLHDEGKPQRDFTYVDDVVEALMEVTCADVSALERETGFRPSIPLEQGLARLVAWYRGHEG